MPPRRIRATIKLLLGPLSIARGQKWIDVHAEGLGIQSEGVGTVQKFFNLTINDF